MNNYARIVRDNIDRFYRNPPENLIDIFPGAREKEGIMFDAFGEPCQIRPEGIILGGEEQTGVLGILLSLYTKALALIINYY